jgi:hypothetical protein
LPLENSQSHTGQRSWPYPNRAGPDLAHLNIPICCKSVMFPNINLPRLLNGFRTFNGSPLSSASNPNSLAFYPSPSGPDLPSFSVSLPLLLPVPTQGGVPMSFYMLLPFPGNILIPVLPNSPSPTQEHTQVVHRLSS